MLSDHLFRRESGRIVAALTRVFGVANLPLVEDVVQDAFARALVVWPRSGEPANPSAWLLATAKNRALDVIRKENTARKFAPEMGRMLESEWTLAATVAASFEPQAIQDEMLRMIFSCCHPKIPQTAQVALVLQLVCGFGVGEVASAFLCKESAMEKRITRAKSALVGASKLFDLSDSELPERLSVVQKAIYLLFNEGYHGAFPERATRRELCEEAIRLGNLLLEHKLTATPSTHALVALMCFHGARMPARTNAAGELLALVDQDRTLWDERLTARGRFLLESSIGGHTLTVYHVEAAIAAVHADSRSVDSTEWDAIVGLYDTLLLLNRSPVVELNRAIAVGQRDGPAEGLKEISSIENAGRLHRYPFYWAGIAEFNLKLGHVDDAAANFTTAVGVARNAMERKFLRNRIAHCKSLRALL